MRRAGIAIALLGLFGVAIAAGLDSTARPVSAQSTIDLLETEVRADFSQQVETKNPALTESLVSLQSVNGSSTLPFPHMALYGGPNSSGWPMVGTLNDTRPGPTEPLNESVMNAYARFPHLILPTTPLADTRPDILTSLRSRNPKISIHAYVMGHTTWCPDDGNGNIAYAPGVYYRDYYLAVTGGDPSCASTSGGFLWMQDGIKADMPPHNLGMNVNLAHRVQNPDSSYTYDVAERIAEAMYAYGGPDRNWDGMFIDVFCPGIMWIESPGHLYDYARAGYGNDNSNPDNRSAFDLGWQAGHQRLTTRLRELAVADGHPDYPISGNCGQAPTRLHTSLNGWMRENFPFQNGGTMYSNLFTWPWGFLHQDTNFLAPQYNYIFTAANWSGGMTNNPGDEQYNNLNQRKMRFGLGSASLGNGWAAFHHGSGNPAMGYWFNWWYDEYGVNTSVPTSDLNWGKSMNGAGYTGWLGNAKGDMYQMIHLDFNAAPDLLSTNQGFETAGGTPSQLPGWAAFANAPAQITTLRDTTSSGEGDASAKIHINQLGSSDGDITFSPQSTFPIVANQQYSITFRAKASSRRPVTLGFNSQPWPAPSMTISTEWRQYQFHVRATSTTNSGWISFSLGHVTGDVWIDDVHVQSGTSSLYRRDFDHGIVLVNAADTAQTVTLEKPFRKILGTVNPTLNDGSQVSVVTLSGTNTGGGVGDAIFLLDYDVIAPAATTDLRAP